MPAARSTGVGELTFTSVRVTVASTKRALVTPPPRLFSFFSQKLGPFVPFARALLRVLAVRILVLACRGLPTISAPAAAKPRGEPPCFAAVYIMGESSWKNGGRASAAITSTCSLRLPSARFSQAKMAC